MFVCVRARALACVRTRARACACVGLFAEKFIDQTLPDRSAWLVIVVNERKKRVSA